MQRDVSKVKKKAGAGEGILWDSTPTAKKLGIKKENVWA
jgi:hypothetical protein